VEDNKLWNVGQSIAILLGDKNRMKYMKSKKKVIQRVKKKPAKKYKKGARRRTRSTGPKRNKRSYHEIK
jgi:hypothetical protein